MPTWLTHLRTAEIVKKYIFFPLDEENYYVGALSADCGDILLDANGQRYYDPPRYVTHWTQNVPDWDAPIYFNSFYETYIKNEWNTKRKSFYIGYYIHLITDTFWIEFVTRPVRESFPTPEEYAKTAKDKLREEIYFSELLYLKTLERFQPFEILKNVKSFKNVYLDYFSETIINNRIQNVDALYKLSRLEENPGFTYFKAEQYNDIINLSAKIIMLNLQST